MKKHTIIIALFALCITQMAAQSPADFDITWTEPVKSGGGGVMGIIGHDDTGFFAMGASLPSVSGALFDRTFRRYNYQMKKTQEERIDLGKGKELRNFESAITLGNQLLVFSSFQNRKQRKNYLFVQRFDQTNLKQVGEMEMIMELDFTRGTSDNSGEFVIEQSNDLSKVMVIAKLPYQRREKEKLKCHVYGKDFNPLMQRDITMPHTDDRYAIKDYVLSNEGRAFILGKFTEGRPQRNAAKLPDYKFEILSYQAEAAAVAYPITVTGKYLVDTQLVINNDQDLICAGFFTEKSGQTVKGSYFMKIDQESRAVVTEKFTDFDVELISKNMGKGRKKTAVRKDAKGKGLELPDYEVSDLMLRTDGGIVLVGEQIKEITQQLTDRRGNAAMTTRNYRNSIMVLNMTPEGTIEWSDKIAKKQYTNPLIEGLMSYCMMADGDRLHLFYNEMASNLNRDESKLKLFKGDKTTVARLVTYNKAGERTDKMFSTYDELKMWMVPGYSYDLGNGEMILINTGRSNQQLARVRVKD